MTQIDVSLSSDLEWTSPSDPQGCYTLSFCFNDLDLFDPATFNAYLLAVETFSAAYPDSKKVIMAELDGTFPFIRIDTDAFERAQTEINLPIDLICANLFSDYLHRLASALPEEAVPTILINFGSQKSKARMIWLFCKRRFEHFQIEFKGNSLPIIGNTSSILSLPQDTVFDLDFFEQKLLQYVECTCIPEEYLNEYWDEASEILYDSETIGELGERMLLGFEAAGGVIKKAR